jgi:Putative lumazine-binding
VSTLTEAERITQPVLDYFEGWFEGDPVRMERALHPDLVKRRSGEKLGVTTKEMMVEATERGAGKGIAAEAVVEIEIHDVYDDIASVTVHAPPYHEYLHLVRTDVGWKIANTLWQKT